MDNPVDNATKEIERILDTYGLQYSYKTDFPIYRILPVEVELALHIIKKHRMRINVILIPKKDMPQK